MNKYETWYQLLITSRQNRELPIGEYTEKHHIIPRSLGGTDSADNLIILTAREHFIAHLLLARIHSGNSGMKMVHALRRMLTGNNRYIPNSRTYSVIRKLSMEKCSGEHNPMFGRTGESHPNFGKYDQIWTEELRQKVGASSKGRKWTPEQRAKLVQSHKEKWSDPEFKQKMSDAHRGKPKSEEHKEKIRQALKGRVFSEETRTKMSNAKKKNKDA
jgi:hypothetical protein